MTEKPIFPNASVQLSGEDGNAFAIMGRVKNALVKAGATKEQVSEFFSEAMAGDYDDLLVTCSRWVSVK